MFIFNIITTMVAETDYWMARRRGMTQKDAVKSALIVMGVFGLGVIVDSLGTALRNLQESALETVVQDAEAQVLPPVNVQMYETSPYKLNSQVNYGALK